MRDWWGGDDGLALGWLELRVLSGRKLLLLLLLLERLLLLDSLLLESLLMLLTPLVQV